MTECERIIKDGILPKSFFKPETICDFYVDENRKKLWAVALDLLLVFDSVCQKNQLQYTLLGGTLLGAVRHKGFIPWDDDIDVVMPRLDYEKFIGMSSEFNTPYFLQTSYTDDGYFFAHARLRNSNTTFIQRPFCYQNYNMGVFIDILPFDDFAVDEEAEAKVHRLEELHVRNSTFMKLSNPYPNERDRERINSYPHNITPFETFDEIHEIAQSYSNEDTGWYCLTCGVAYGFKKILYDKQAYKNIILGDFEGFKFPMPVDYDDVLKRVYGDYMSYPPVSKRGVWHGACWIDTDNSYLAIKATPSYKKWATENY